jgi:septum formation protein
LYSKIILASSSPYRKELFSRLQLNFDCISPDIDESINVNESAENYVCRLAIEKAQAVASSNADALIIGSDQCALLDEQILGKPGSHSNALKQLQQSRGRTVVFHTGLCVLHLKSGFKSVEDVLFEVDFRELSDSQLEHYLKVEKPYNCAGSFKSEGYGACLFSRMRGDDPSALIGLPLFRLISMLEAAGVEVV